MSYFYIASPYTHKDPAVMVQRYEKVLDFTGFLIDNYEMHVFSPIVHSHHLCKDGKRRPDFDFWMELDKTMIRSAEALVILQIDGWSGSKGVTAEIEFAREIGKPIYYSLASWMNYDHRLELP